VLGEQLRVDGERSKVVKSVASDESLFYTRAAGGVCNRAVAPSRTFWWTRAQHDHESITNTSTTQFFFSIHLTITV